MDAAILLSMEAVFATLFGYLFLRESLAGQQVIGCALMLAAMILAQVSSYTPTLHERTNSRCSSVSGDS